MRNESRPPDAGVGAPPRLVFLLHSAQRRLMQWLDAEQRRHAPADAPMPTAAQAAVLFALAGEPRCTMGRLAAMLDLAPSAATGLAQRMEALGWLQRRTSPDDGRSQQVELTAAGRAWLPQLQRLRRRVNDALGHGFSADELQTVGRWLRHVQSLGEVREPSRG